jgi:tetraacyldisaccharide-1-P 4'-kinase
MTTLTHEQKQAVEQAGDEPVELTDPQTHTAYVLVRADVFQRMKALLEEEEDRREHEAWGKLAEEARVSWMKENPY